MCRIGVWCENREIQAFIEVYKANSNIHELESTLELSYKFINPGGPTILFSPKYRNNYHYNSLILKGSKIQSKQSIKRKRSLR